MGKKALKLPSLFKTKEAGRKGDDHDHDHDHHHHHPWQFMPSCGNSKTLSFRGGSDDMFKTVNSVFFDPSESTNETSWFTTSSESASISTESEDYYNCDGESLEMLVRGVRSERLFFEPGDTSSILEKAKTNSGFPFNESVVLAMESEDPYEDFKRSMEEMVESHGVRDWEGLEELLSCYLRVNGKNNHAFILAAFVDLLFSIATASSNHSNSSSHSTTAYSSALSSFASSPLCAHNNHILHHYQ
ncbi:Transcription repressor OFP13, partial [Mucuna pruriens]